MILIKEVYAQAAISFGPSADMGLWILDEVYRQLCMQLRRARGEGSKHSKDAPNTIRA